MEEKCLVNPCKNERVKNTCLGYKRISDNEREIIKDPVCNILKGKSTVIVSNKSNFKALLMKCEKLLDNDVEEICIHALGAAIVKACNLALRVQEDHKYMLDLKIETSTVTLHDNIIPETDDDNLDVRERLNSAIKIRVCRKIPVTSLKFKK